MKPAKWQSDAILDRFRDWLERTAQEVTELADEPSREPSPPRSPESFIVVPGEAEPRGAELFAGVVPRQEAPVPSPQPISAIGLRQLCEALIALRHEVKLQTKNSRGQEELVQRALQGLADATRVFQEAQATPAVEVVEAARETAETLIEWHEAVSRGFQAFESFRAQCRSAVASRKVESRQDDWQAVWSRLPRWKRWLLGSDLARGNLSSPPKESPAPSQTMEFLTDLDRLAQGFALIQARLERSLKEYQVQRISCLGRPVDPSLVSVVELVDDPTAPPESVVAELRPGYLWRGAVLRYAEVRATRSPVSSAQPHFSTTQGE